MKTFNRKLLWLSCLILIIITSCNTAKKALRSGDYETAIQKCIQKLQHHDNDDAAIILESAFDKAYYSDMNQINYLKKEGDPNQVTTIYKLYTEIRNRYNQVQPLLPLHINSKNRDANFKNVSDEDLIGAKNKAAEFLYAKANVLLSTKNRFDAREAYSMLIELKNLYSNYQNTDQLIQQALLLGKTFVAYRWNNNSYVTLPNEVQNNIGNIPVNSLKILWQEYLIDMNDTSIHFNYRYTFYLDKIYVSPENLAENDYKESKQVEDGWEYVLDAHGNVMKDSSGNDIKKPKYKTITAFVKDITQNKTALIQGHLDLIDLSNGNVLLSLPVQNTVAFQNKYTIANGELLALTDATKEKLKNPPLPFPADLDMLIQNSQQLNPMILSLISSYQNMIQ